MKSRYPERDSQRQKVEDTSILLAKAISLSEAIDETIEAGNSELAIELARDRCFAFNVDAAKDLGIETWEFAKRVRQAMHGDPVYGQPIPGLTLGGK